MASPGLSEMSGRETADEARLRDALSAANIPTLIAVLVQLTGETRWISAPFRPRHARGLDDNDSAGLSESLQSTIRSAAYDAVLAYHRGALIPSQLTPEGVAELLAATLDEDVPSDYGQILAEEMGLISRNVDVPDPEAGFAVLIIGAGMSGLCAAIKLEGAGIDFTVLEKDLDVGGAWLENVYPGAGVDTPSHLYSFSFAPSSTWSRYFAKRDEVFQYFGNVADRYGVRKRIRFGTEVVRADFDEASSSWRVRVRTPSGEVQTLSANVLISAVGMVNRPSIPPIPGLEGFEGPMMHTAEWDPATDLRGKRVAVVGNGASAMQLVPSIAGIAERILVFQRSRQWALPHPNYQRAVDERVRYLLEQVPFYAAWYRLRAFWNFSDRLHPSLQIDPSWAHPERSINADNERHRVFLTKYIKSQLGDRADLIEACVPDYPPYGKRPLIDNGWYASLLRDDVELISDSVTEVRPHSVITGAGVEYDADVLVLATGFKTLQFLWPMEVVGRSGRTLRDQWGTEDARAYLGMTVPDFPNFFILNGPNTNAGHGGSAVIATELQVRYMMQGIAHLIRVNARTTEVRPEVFWAYNNELDIELSRSIWVHPGMTTYYRNDAGRVVVSSPWKYIDYWRRTLEFRAEDYEAGSFSRLGTQAAS